MSVIRFPPYVDLREGKAPMATLLSWLQRLTKKRRPANVAALRIARARRERQTISGTELRTDGTRSRVS